MERVSRRGFITSAGVGVVGAAALRGAEAEAASATVLAAGEPVPITLRVNGRARTLSVLPRTTLLEALREHLGLAGTKPGCERGECGACTVLLDGETRYACQMLALEAEGHDAQDDTEIPASVLRTFLVELRHIATTCPRRLLADSVSVQDKCTSSRTQTASRTGLPRPPASSRNLWSTSGEAAGLDR